MKNASKMRKCGSKDGPHRVKIGSGQWLNAVNEQDAWAVGKFHGSNNFSIHPIPCPCAMCPYSGWEEDNKSLQSNCPECHGTGKYTGMNVVEDCSLCT